MRVIIPAAGAGRRWGMHGGIRKHQAPIGGVPVLARLIAQCNAVGLAPVVLCHPDHPYTYPGATYEVVAPGRWRNDIGKLAVTRPWWSPSGPTVILFGDVYLTDAAAREVFTHRAQWTMYGRLTRYSYGAKARSQLAISFGPGDRRLMWRHIKAVHRIPAAVNQGAHGGLRKLYQSLTGQVAGPKPTRNLGHLVTIDDQSDDIDRPKHWLMIRKAVGDADA